MLGVPWGGTGGWDKYLWWFDWQDLSACVAISDHGDAISSKAWKPARRSSASIVDSMYPRGARFPDFFKWFAEIPLNMLHEVPSSL